MKTLKDVADAAGVSTATVSYVLNQTKPLSEETTRRVLEAVERTQYKPRLRQKKVDKKRTFTIGVLAEDIRSLPVPQVVEGLSESLEAMGYRMLFEDLHLHDKLYNNYEQLGLYRAKINAALSHLSGALVDGVVYVGMLDRNLNGILDAIAKPIIYAYSVLNDGAFVTYDNATAAADVTRYLIGMGHRRIGVIAGPPHAYPSMQRIVGYQIAMQQASLPINPQWTAYGDWERESGLRCARMLLSLPDRPTAIFVLNDLMAAGCIRCAEEMGLRVPQDLSVFGFDDREIAMCLIPQLSTVRIPTREIGLRCGEALTRHLENPKEPMEQLTLSCELIHRESVCRIGGKLANASGGNAPLFSP